MIKKFQQYLLVNHPLLWNIKIFPLIIISIILNICFFGIGYIFTNIDFLSRYGNYNSLVFDKPLLFFCIVLIILTVLIIWLVNYSKNNAFKVFYPKSTSSLYLEWVMTFIIVAGLMLIPLSYQKGVNIKIKTYATKEETNKAVEIINMIGYLVPKNKQDYFKEYPDGYKRNKNGQLVELQAGEYSTSSYYDVEEIDSIVKIMESELVQFPNFAQLSLLNKDTTYREISTYRWMYDFPEKDDLRDTGIVKRWLIAENKAEIEKLIGSFLQLVKKHNLNTNMTKEKWMSLVYNPPKYPVGDFNIILPYDPYNEYYNDDESERYHNYIPLDELSTAYSKIFDAHYDIRTEQNMLISFICISGIISLLIFSFRSTNGKSWLIALVIGGIVTIANVILTIIVHESYLVRGGDSSIIFFTVFWLIFFIAELIYIIRLNRRKRNKEFSNIVINHLIWLIPLIPVFILIMIYGYTNNYYYGESDVYIQHPIRKFIDDHLLELVWGNVALSFLTVWIFIKTILRKWKSLPEQ